MEEQHGPWIEAVGAGAAALLLATWRRLRVLGATPNGTAALTEMLDKHTKTEDAKLDAIERDIASLTRTTEARMTEDAAAISNGTARIRRLEERDAEMREALLKREEALTAIGKTVAILLDRSDEDRASRRIHGAEGGAR